MDKKARSPIAKKIEAAKLKSYVPTPLPRVQEQNKSDAPPQLPAPDKGKSFITALRKFEPGNKLVVQAEESSGYSSESSSVGRSLSNQSKASSSSSFTVEDERIRKLMEKMREDETRWSRRKHYRSLFENAPLYQEYQKVSPPCPKPKPSVKEGDGSPRVALRSASSTEFFTTGNSQFAVSASALVDRNDVESKLSSVKKSASSPLPRREVKVKRSLSDRLAGSGPSRPCWSRMAEVEKAGILKKMSREEILVQEAQFELITSEASYYRSLNILVSNFYESPEFNCSSPGSVISITDKHHLFSNVLRITTISEDFLNDLETRWKRDCPRLTEVCDIVIAHVEENFEPFVTYLRNQSYQNEALTRLNQQDAFRAVLDRLQQDAECSKLPFNSFISLPLHRLTRLRLLVEVIVKRMLEANCSRHLVDTAKQAHAALKKRLDASETEKHIMDQKSRLMTICSTLDFPENCKRIPINGVDLVKEGELKVLKLVGSESYLQRRSKKNTNFYLILLSTVLLITQKKNNRFKVLDCSNRGTFFVSRPYMETGLPVLRIQSQDGPPTPTSPKSERLGDSSCVFHMTLLKSHCEIYKTIHFMTSSKEECDSWYEVLCPVQITHCIEEETFGPDVRPLVVSVTEYAAMRPGELSLLPGQLVRLTQRAGNGWLYGECVSTSTTGWFPRDVTLEVMSEHVVKRVWGMFLENYNLSQNEVLSTPNPSDNWGT